MKRRFNSRKKEKGPLDLDITSLLDVLVILLVFLLKSYNASDLSLDLIPNLSLARSESDKLGNDAITIQVNRPKEVFVQGEKVGVLTGDGLLLPFLSEKLLALIEKRGEESLSSASKVSVSSKREPAENTSQVEVNIVLDEELKYSEMRQIMHTCASSGLGHFKFIVQSNYE